MGTQRASNKDILDAINALTQAITATHVAPAPVAGYTADGSEFSLGMQPVSHAPAPETAAPAPVGEATIEVDKAYQDVVTRKIQKACDTDGQDRIMYARLADIMMVARS